MPSVDSIKRELRSSIEDSKQSLALLSEESAIIKADLEEKREAFRAALSPLHDHMSEAGLKRLESVIERSGLQIKAVAEVHAQKEASTESSALMAQSVAKHGSDLYLEQKTAHAIDAVHRTQSALKALTESDLMERIVLNPSLRTRPEWTALDLREQARMLAPSFLRTQSPSADTPTNRHIQEMAELYKNWKDDIQTLREEKTLRRKWQSSMLSDHEIETRLAHKFALALAKNISVKDNFVREYGEDANPALLALAKFIALEQFQTQMISQERHLMEGIEHLESMVSRLDKVKGHKEIKADLSTLDRAVRLNGEKLEKYVSDIESRRLRIQDYTPSTHHRPADYFNHMYIYALAYGWMEANVMDADSEQALHLADSLQNRIPDFKLETFDMDMFNWGKNGLETIHLDTLSAAIHESIDTNSVDDLTSTSGSSGHSWTDYTSGYDSGSSFSMD